MLSLARSTPIEDRRPCNINLGQGSLCRSSLESKIFRQAKKIKYYKEKIAELYIFFLSKNL